MLSKTIPMYTAEENKTKKFCKSPKFSLFIEIVTDDKTFLIRKSTAVWLLQEGERVSSDRLFRVR